MAQFKFNETVSPETNINLFFEHLESIDKEMTDLLRKNVQNLYPCLIGMAEL